MDRLKMHSVNKVDDNIKRIAELFPNALTEVIKGYQEDGAPIIEHAIDFDALKQELSDIIVEGSEERYQFTWPDKKKSILLANAPITKTLRPCREESVDFDTTENLYIEGDNLDVLKLLQETYLGKVKMIYIDPPYNTGNDFVYEDDFAQSIDEYLANSGQFDKGGNRLVQNTETNGRFHTDWLNMMYPRLKLAKDLLRDDGVIFVSIDDNEDYNIRKLLNEIFGEENFVNVLHVKRAAKNLNIQFKEIKTLNVGIEYILVYRKSKDFVWINPYKKALEKRKMGYWTSFYNNADRPTMRYELLGVNIKQGQWKWEKKRALTAVKNFEEFQKKYSYNNEEEELVLLKKYWEDTGSCKEFIKLRNGRPHYWVWPSEVQLRTSDWTDLYINDNRGKRKYGFDTVKNVNVIKTVVNAATEKDDIVLDFFSGSATTAEAVIHSNANGGSRKFIMVQLPEPCDEKSEAYKAGYKTIAEIGKERIRRAGKKILEKYPEAAGKLDIGFRVLKLDSSNMRDVYYRPDEYTQDLLFSLTDNIKPDRTPEDLLFQVMLDLGVLLSSKIEETVIGGKKVFNVADGYLIACFDNDVTGEVVKEIAKKQPYYAVFRDSGIASDSVAANFEQIFETYSPSTIRKVL